MSCTVGLMNPEFKPWEKYTALKAEHLSRIATLIRDVRKGCVDLYEPEKGDGPWSLGTRVYERTFFAIKELAKIEAWLGINKEFHALQFSFNIGPVPLRYFRGDPEDPPSHYLAHTDGELIQLQTCLHFDDRPTIDSILRFAVEVDSTRQAAAVFLIEIDEYREVIGQYQIPFESAANVNIRTFQTPPINLAPVKAEPIKTETTTEASQRETKSNAGSK
jgi:hypothetical protein